MSDVWQTVRQLTTIISTLEEAITSCTCPRLQLAGETQTSLHSDNTRVLLSLLNDVKHDIKTDLEQKIDERFGSLGEKMRERQTFTPQSIKSHSTGTD